MRKKTVRHILVWVLALMLVPGLFTLDAAATTPDKDGDGVYVIVLDPGHGGSSGGAVATHDGKKIVEQELCWDIANYCKEYLEETYSNVKVYLTREEEENPELVERANYAQELGADFFLSIHLNATDTHNARGAYALVPEGKYNPAQGLVSQDVGSAILNQLENLGIADRGFFIETTSVGHYPDGSKWDSYNIIRYCVYRDIPGIIMEQCFMDNYSDYTNFLNTDEKLRAMGIANALGLAQELDLVLMGEEPEEPTEPSEPSEPEEPAEPEEPSGLPFADVEESQWFYEAVAYVYEKGLMNGISDVEFAPDATANRAMTVALLYRMDGSGEQAQTTTFTDVSPEQWYYDYIEWAAARGIAKGISETEFAPEQPVLREQFVTFLYRYAQMLGDCDLTADPLDSFADGAEVGDYARESMGWALNHGILTGYTDGTVKPQRELSRAELATLICRFDRFVQGEEPQEPPIEEEPPVEEPPVEEEPDVWTISHTDVTIKVGETFRLRLRNQDSEVAEVTWKASKDGYVTIDGNKITGAAKGTITVSCQWEGQTYSCIVRVKNP